MRVETLHELFSAADVLSHAPRSLGDRLAVITNAGGLGVLSVDRAEDLGIELAALSEATRARLAQLLPPHATHANPIDILGDAPPERYREVLELCLTDGDIDGVLLLLTPQAMTRPEEVAAAVAACEHDARKPVVTCFSPPVVAQNLLTVFLCTSPVSLCARCSASLSWLRIRL